MSPTARGRCSASARQRPGSRRRSGRSASCSRRSASRRPLVVVFDDIHWGESTFLDLLEYLADWIQRGPVLMVCLARPELLESRPGWMTGEARTRRSITLEPLTRARPTALISNLVGGAELAADGADRIAEVAEGNPLFVEETLRMLVDDGAAAARRAALERRRTTVARSRSRRPSTRCSRPGSTGSTPSERAVIERASVVGRSSGGAPSPSSRRRTSRPDVAGCLQSLVRKELIRPERSELRRARTHSASRTSSSETPPTAASRRRPGGACTSGSPTGSRRTRASWPGEYEEIVGYHLEQAHRLLLELGPTDDRAATRCAPARPHPGLGRPAGVRARGHAGGSQPPQPRHRPAGRGGTRTTPSFCSSSPSR